MAIGEAINNFQGIFFVWRLQASQVLESRNEKYNHDGIDAGSLTDILQIMGLKFGEHLVGD